MPQNKPTTDPTSIRLWKGTTVKFRIETMGQIFQPLTISGSVSLRTSRCTGLPLKNANAARKHAVFSKAPRDWSKKNFVAVLGMFRALAPSVAGVYAGNFSSMYSADSSELLSVDGEILASQS